MADSGTSGSDWLKTPRTEVENVQRLSAGLSDSRVKHAAAQRNPLPFGSKAAEGKYDQAVMGWIAVSTRVWLKQAGAASIPIVERIWKFEEGESDIDMRIGVHGEYRKIKVITYATGPVSYRIQILTWKRNGEAEKVWERYGTMFGQGDFVGIQTCPVSK